MASADATGLLDLEPFSSTEVGRKRWAALAARLASRPFLRSEGVNASLAVPTRAAPWLVEQSRELVRRFDHFYRLIVDAKGSLAEEPAVQIGEPYQRIAALEPSSPPLPLSRFDCVLEPDGTLKVIELNPIGVCTLHLRSAAYLAHALRSTQTQDPALERAASAIDELSVMKTRSIRRFADANTGRKMRNIGIVLLPNMHRGSVLFWRRELADAGFTVTVGRPQQLQIVGDEARLDGRPIDALWVDWVAYLGFQQQRYEQTRFASRAGDFSTASSVTEAMLSLPGLTAMLQDRRLTLVSPLRGYRALSKGLLAWIDRPELPLSDEERRYLRKHTARTFDHRARTDGGLSLERARQERASLVLKPCRFGGSHGVVLGRDLDDEAWTRRLDAIWTDPEWVLQSFADPISDAAGARLSYGLYNYAGELGGLLVRSANELVISARTASTIIAVIGES